MGAGPFKNAADRIHLQPGSNPGTHRLGGRTVTANPLSGNPFRETGQLQFQSHAFQSLGDQHDLEIRINEDAALGRVNLLTEQRFSQIRHQEARQGAVDHPDFTHTQAEHAIDDPECEIGSESVHRTLQTVPGEILFPALAQLLGHLTLFELQQISADTVVDHRIQRDPAVISVVTQGFEKNRPQTFLVEGPACAGTLFEESLQNDFGFATEIQAPP